MQERKRRLEMGLPEVRDIFSLVIMQILSSLNNLCHNFFHILARKPKTCIEKFTIYSNKFFHNFLSCPNPFLLVQGFGQVG